MKESNRTNDTLFKTYISFFFFFTDKASLSLVKTKTVNKKLVLRNNTNIHICDKNKLIRRNLESCDAYNLLILLNLVELVSKKFCLFVVVSLPVNCEIGMSDAFRFLVS
jgi:hypothetical protein